MIFSEKGKSSAYVFCVYVTHNHSCDEVTVRDTLQLIVTMAAWNTYYLTKINLKSMNVQLKINHQIWDSCNTFFN